MINIKKFDLLPDYVDSINKKKIVYIGASGTSGYAYAAYSYLHELIKKNIPVKYIPYYQSNKVDNTEFSLHLKKLETVEINTPTEIIVHSIPEQWDTLLKSVTIQPNCEVTGRTVWEFNILPTSWVEAINNSIVTKVSVPTQWNKDVFAKCGVTKPIVIEPHCHIDVKTQQYDIEHLWKKGTVISHSDITFLEVQGFYKFFCIEQLTSRKNLKATIHAFCKAFKSTDKVVLFVKTFRVDYSEPEQSACKKYLNDISTQYEDHAPIIYIKDQLNYDEIQSMFHNFDCYFSLTRTEGFGLSIFNAYKQNKKVIVTGYGGHVEYLGKDYHTLLRYKKIPVNDYITRTRFLNDVYEWAEPDITHAIELLQETYKIEMESEKYCVSDFGLKNINVLLHRQHPDIEFIDLPYDKNNFYFNSSIFKLNDKKYLMSRYTHINANKSLYNTLKLFDLNKEIKEIPLIIKDEVPNEQYEDPRVLVHNDKIYVGCANYQRNVSKKIHQKILVFDTNFKHIDNIHPIYEGNEINCLSNTTFQKNWTYFVHDDKILCVYKMYPHTVVEFDNKGRVLTEYKTHTDITKTWRFGEPRMGSNPIFKDGVYYNFFHSSIPWKNSKRQYFMGLYTFEANPPFKIISISKLPILWGNESDFRFLPNFNPIVVFPCGVIYENDNFHVSFGFNDEKTGIIKI